MENNLDRMRALAADILKADPDNIAWFRYGASYVACLLQLVDFYRSSARDAEARDVAEQLLQQPDSKEAIARNLLRLGVYLDELEQVNAGRQAGLSLETMLDIVRNPIK